MLWVGELILTNAIGETVSTLVRNLLSRLGIEIGDDDEAEELIQALEEAQWARREAEERAQEAREARESTEELLIQEKRVLDLMERRGYDREMLLQRYKQRNRLPVILIAAADKDDGEENSYLKDKLNEEYDAQPVAGALKVIPPNEIPDWITNDSDVKQWVEELVDDISKEPPSGVYLATQKDLKEIYSEIDTSRFDNGWKTAGEIIDEVLGREDLQELINSAPVSPLSLVQDGDLQFLAHGALTTPEIDEISRHHQLIESELDDPDLRTLAKETTTDELVTAMEDFIEKPERTAEALKEESETIFTQLRKSDVITTV